MISQIAAQKLLKNLDNIESGNLELTTPDGKTYVFSGRNPGVNARMELKNWNVLSNMALKGDTGLAQDYFNGNWETSDLENLISLGMMNDNSMKNFVFGNKFFQFLSRISYSLRSNTISGSRKNIHAHYDLGNKFYSLWLDPTMTYSSALFEKKDESLSDAQNNKYDAIIDRLTNDSGRVLEIGCGWGGFADRCMQKKDYWLKGITLSDEQHAYARDRLANKATIALEDYRHQSGKFDNIVSIEMFEAVGEEYWPTYFNKIAHLLKQGGKAVVQTITIDNQRFDSYRKGSDAIRSFIFPGGMLPSPSRFQQEAEKAGLRVNETFHFGRDYARTCQIWLNSFEQNLDKIRELGFDDSFIRLWRFYLAACIAGFKTGRTSVMQAELQHHV